MHRTKHHDPATCCCFMPPYVVQRLARSSVESIREVAFNTAVASATGETMRLVSPAALMGRSATPGLGKRRTVYDMESRYDPLPGTLKRKENQAATGQPEVDQAYDNAGVTHGYYKNVLGRESIDGAGSALLSCVNYGPQVGNAFWDGERMLYGAGDGDLFVSFTGSLSIAAHEMSHGVLSFTSNLDYRDEPGALNESFCDVMGICVVQHHDKSPPADATWFMGGEIVGPSLADIRGFRSFGAEPAYVDHPLIGSDPQPKHMKDYVHTSEDHGGVHINSGIPNHAFFLAARALGGHAWDRPAKIWFNAFTGMLNKRATFLQAAQATTVSARELFGDETASVVSGAWRDVGIDPEGKP